MLNLAIQQHEIITGGIVLLIVFSVGKFGGTYIEEWVRYKCRKAHNDSCNCPAMDMVKEDIPEIKRIQTERTKTIFEIQQTLHLLMASSDRQEKNDQKLFDMFEEEWKSTIRELKENRKDG